MKNSIDDSEYNRRLFSDNLRGKLHLARFRWFYSELKKIKCQTDSIVEIGCFDGKILNFMPTMPSVYVGYDANWEGGLDIARKKWGEKEKYSFFYASSPDEIRLKKSEVFNIAVIMETLEHMPTDMADQYLIKAAQHLDGYLFVTVPNEKGIVFITKWLVKKIFSKDAENYSLSELLNAFLGRMKRIERNEHKGFDYQETIEMVKKHFDIIKVCGIPFYSLPIQLNFGVGIIAKSKPAKNI